MSMAYSSGQPYANGYVHGVHPNSLRGAQPGLQNGSAFVFRKRLERVDWRKLAAVDVDNISRNMDFVTLQDNIMNVAFCNIEAELDIRTVDPNFVKLFKLAQLIIEYMLHSQEYLAASVSNLEEKLRKAQEEHEETKRVIEKQKEELSEVKKESHKRKKMLAAQQQIIHAGANSYNKCQFCSKAFVNFTFLQSHLNRRHGDMLGSAIPQFAQSAPAAAPAAALEKELSEIRERLRLTESQLEDERNTRNAQSQREQALHVRKEQEIQSEMEAWKEDYQAAQKEEMEKMRDMFMRELKEMTEKYTSTQLALQEMQRQSNFQRSGLGVIKDDIDQETLMREREQRREEMEQLREQVERTVQDTQLKMGEQEEIWKRKIKELEEEHRHQLQQLNSQLENASSELYLEREKRGKQSSQFETQIQRLQRQQEQQHEEMKEREKRIVEMASRPPAAVPKDMPVERAEVVKAAAPKAANRPQMAPEEEEEEETSEYETTSGLDNTLGKSGELDNTGSLSLTGTLNQHSRRMLQKLQQDPSVIQAMKKELLNLLDEDLERMGIKKGTTGIKVDKLMRQMDILKNTRQQTAKKYKNLFDIRMQYISEVEQLSREKQAKLAKSPKPPGHGITRPPKGRSREDLSGTLMSTGQLSTSELIGYNQGRSPMAQAKLAKAKSRSEEHMAASPKLPAQQRAFGNREAQTLPRDYASREPPKPAPRGTSPRGKMMANDTLSSTGHTQTLNSTGTGSQWETDTDSEYDDVPDGARAKVSFGSQLHQQQRSQPVASQEQHRSPQPAASQLQRQQPAPTQHHIPYAEDEESDWESASELQEVVRQTSSDSKLVTNKRSSPTVGSAPRPTVSEQIPLKSSPQPKGQMVATLTRSIEEQLNGRTKKKPAGAIDTMGQGPATKKSIADDFDDDDEFSISSLEDNGPASYPPPAARRSVGRSTATDMSNTYGSSQWGTSSKAESTVNRGTRGSVGKSSLVSVTDFDDDDDDFDYANNYRKK